MGEKTYSVSLHEREIAFTDNLASLITNRLSQYMAYKLSHEMKLTDEEREEIKKIVKKNLIDRFTNRVERYFYQKEHTGGIKNE